MVQYKHYSKDFKLQAARLVTEQGYSLKDTAQKLGVSAKGLEPTTFGKNQLTLSVKVFSTLGLLGRC
ncbi:MAG: transposase [Sedimentisphaerales bacterium]